MIYYAAATEGVGSIKQCSDLSVCPAAQGKNCAF